MNHNRNVEDSYYEQEYGGKTEFYDRQKALEEPAASHYEPNGYLPQSFHAVPESDATREYQQIYGPEFTGHPEEAEYRYAERIRSNICLFLLDPSTRRFLKKNRSTRLASYLKFRSAISRSSGSGPTRKHAERRA